MPRYSQRKCFSVMTGYGIVKGPAGDEKGDQSEGKEDRRMKAIETYWNHFLQEKGLDPSTTYYEAFAFGSGERMAEELLKLVLDGKKRATTSSVLSFGDRRLPTVGDYCVILDGKGNPRCVIQTKKARRMIFSEMDFATCALEGEDDSLESWRRNHEYFFGLESKEMGYPFSPDMPILFEEFDVIYK